MIRRNIIIILLLGLSVLLFTRLRWAINARIAETIVRNEHKQETPGIVAKSDPQEIASHSDMHLPKKIFKEEMRKFTKAHTPEQEADAKYRRFVEDYANSFKSDPPKLMDKWFTFAQQRKCSLDQSSYKRIMADLQPFKDKFKACVAAGKCKTTDPVITPEQISRAGFMPHVTTINIKDGKIFSDDEQFSWVIIEALKHFGQLPNMKLVINKLDEPRVFKRKPKAKEFHHAQYDITSGMWTVRDNGDINDLMDEVCDSDKHPEWKYHGFFKGPCSFLATDNLVPVFSSSSIGKCFADIIFPSHYYLHSLKSAIWSVPLPKDGTDRSAWEQKSNTFHWRGSSTGGCANSHNNYTFFHRQQFVNSSKHMNIDGIASNVDFSAILQCSGETCEKQRQMFGPLAAHEQPSVVKSFKYLPDIDGNTFSQRFMSFLRFSQALIFKIHAFEDWLTESTVPNKHYIPVKMDLSDLKEKIEWAKKNDEQARLIAVEAQMHAHQHLRYDDMMCYLYRLVLEYHKLTLPQGDIPE